MVKVKGRQVMPQTLLRVLVVDDNRDGADALGMLAEEFGHQVHVTYGGEKALEVAQVFQPDLMLIDLAMPDMDGCSLVKHIHKLPDFAHTKLVAITGHADQGHKTFALKAGFDTVLFKPVALTEFKSALGGAACQTTRGKQFPRLSTPPAHPIAEHLLPMEEARRIKQSRPSKTLTEAESRAAICDSFVRFQTEYLGWRSEQIQIHFINDLLVIRVRGGLTLAECQLAKAATPEKGRDLIKQVRKQLLETARPFLESMIHEVTGVRAESMHHDISTASGEEMVLFSLSQSPRFEENPSVGDTRKKSTRKY